MRNRSLFFTAAALTSACLTSAFVGCGSSSNGNGPGSEAGTETDSSSGNPEAGTEDGPSSTGDGATTDGATGDAVGPTVCMPKTPPSGTPLVAAGDAGASSLTLELVTSDNQVVFLEGGALNAVPVAGGTPTTIGTWDGSEGIVGTANGAVVYWNGANQKAAPYFGTLSAWTANGGLKTPGAAKSLLSGVGQGYVDISADGQWILYTDNATATTADIYVAPLAAEGGAPVQLATGVSIGANCAPNLHFAGEYAVIGYCTSQGDGGTNIATIDAFSTGATGWATRTNFTSVGREAFTTDKAGTQIGWLEPGGNYVEPLAGGTAKQLIDPSAGLEPVFSDDGTKVFYLTANGLSTSTVASPSPVALASGAFVLILGVSPDASTVFLAKGQDSTTFNTDLYMASALPSDAGAGALTLSTAQTATFGGFGPQFTADGTQALYFAGITATPSGNAFVGDYYHLPMPGTALGTKITGNVWQEWTTTAAKTLYNDNYLYMGSGNGYADIEALDLGSDAGTTTPTTLVTNADANFFVSGDKKTVVYSWSYCTKSAPAGIYTIAAP